MRARAARTGGWAMLALLISSACAPDGPDAYTATEEESAAVVTRAPLDSVPADGTPGDADDDRTDGAVEEVAPNGEVVQVRSLDNTFRAAEIEIVAGTEVLWTNNGRNDHDVVPVEEGADWGVDLEDFAPGSEYAHVFASPGVHDYYCTIHGTPEAGMIGRVVVLPAET